MEEQSQCQCLVDAGLGQGRVEVAGKDSQRVRLALAMADENKLREAVRNNSSLSRVDLRSPGCRHACPQSSKREGGSCTESRWWVEEGRAKSKGSSKCSLMLAQAVASLPPPITSLAHLLCTVLHGSIDSSGKGSQPISACWISSDFQSRNPSRDSTQVLRPSGLLPCALHPA